jgi:hypothetical protein
MNSLARITGRFEQACLSLDQKVAYALTIYPLNPVIAKSIIAFCIIKLHDQWNTRCRELILKSALGNCKTLSGTTLPRSVTDNPVQKLRNVWSRNKPMDASWEPDWHVPAVSVRAADLLGIANYQTVANAISAVTVVDSLRRTRNVIAHELPRTYQMFRNIQSGWFNPPSYCPTDYAIQRIPGTADLIIEGWMNELKLALRAAIR